MDYRELHYLLLIGFNRSNREITKRVYSDNLTPGQPKILEFLLGNNGCTQKEIGRGCALDKSTVTSLISRMEDGGLIRREADDKDRRVTRIYLTELGEKRAKRVKEVFGIVDKAAWGEIPLEERESFMRTFIKIINNLESMEEDK